MAVPKQRHSKSRKRKRRAQKDKMDAPDVAFCPNPQCGAPMEPHKVCPECGTIRRKDGTFLTVFKSKEEKDKEREEKPKAK
ncbi:MAG: 50S ribosomal protein L32 [Pseudomonadota bacterium]